MEINSGELHFKTSWNSQIKLRRDYVLIVIFQIKLEAVLRR